MLEPARPALGARGIRAGYGRHLVLHDVDLDVAPGKVTAVIGPNGCGKSTLLRVIARLLKPTAGEVMLGGTPLTELAPRHLARRIAMLPQKPVAPDGMTVNELVARGRQPHQPWYRQWSEADERIVDDAMSATGVADLAERRLDQLSGGQAQRAWIALTLAQQTELLLLDEPTTHLDLAHAVEVLELLVGLRRDVGQTVVVVLHDLALAARFCDELVVMHHGRLVAAGPPAEVVTADLLLEVFGLRARVLPDPVDGVPTVVPVAHA